jgi:hypothetical protein
MGLETAAIVALSATAVSATAQAVIANEAAEEQGKIAEARAASEEAQRQEQERRDFRRRRIAEARVRQGAANTGIRDSSGESGALGSISSGGASFQSNQRTQSATGDIIADARGRINELTNISNAIGAANKVVQAGTSLFPRTPTAPKTTVPPPVG